MPDPTTPPRRGGLAARDDALDVWITRTDGGASVLTAEGEIDTLTRSRFEAAVAGLLDGPGQPYVIDLSGVTFLASCGLAALIRGADRARERGVGLRLVTATRAVRRPLESTGSDRLFEMFSDPVLAGRPVG